jgi:hypothetical protein
MPHADNPTGNLHPPAQPKWEAVGRPCSPADEKHAVTFAVPMNAKGLRARFLTV